MNSSKMMKTLSRYQMWYKSLEFTLKEDGTGKDSKGRDVYWDVNQVELSKWLLKYFDEYFAEIRPAVGHSQDYIPRYCILGSEDKFMSYATKYKEEGVNIAIKFLTERSNWE